MQRHASPSERPRNCVWCGIRSTAYTTTKAIAQTVPAPRRASASSSARGLGSPGGTTGSRSPGFSRGFVRCRKSSTAAATRKSFGLARFTLEPLADDHADDDQRGRRDEPGDEPFWNRAEVADRPAAAVVRVLRVLDVGDYRVQIPVRQRFRREARHYVRADPDGLRDLGRSRILQRRRDGVHHVTALGNDLVATGAAIREEV